MVAAPGSLPIDSALIEAEFPFLSEVTYFNTAAEGVLPVRARRAFEVAAARKQRAWGLRMEDYFGEPMELRAAVARLIERGLAQREAVFR